MQASYDAAFTDGTRQNRRRQIRAYFMFMTAYNLNPYAPTLIDILLYIQCLANSYKTVTAVKNYLSGAKTSLQQMGIPIFVFLSPLVANLFKGLTRLSTHVPAQAPALRLIDIKRICDLLAALGPSARVARAAILLAFATFLRQSNLLPTPSPAAHHCIRRSDISLEEDVTWVRVNSSKTISDPKDAVRIPVYKSSSRYCPVNAYVQYALSVPLPADAQAFMLTPTVPLSPQKLNSFLRATLTVIKHPQAKHVTVHSLLRSAAQACARAGASEADVMLHGTWSSSAVYAYVPKRLY